MAVFLAAASCENKYLAWVTQEGGPEAHTHARMHACARGIHTFNTEARTFIRRTSTFIFVEDRCTFSLNMHGLFTTA